MPISETYNMDCMDYMKSIPDKHFELAIVDPPYQIASNPSRHGGSGAGKLKYRIMNQSAHKFKSWDVKPTKEYFDELFRISKNQIIWGGNYFGLPSCRCFVCWDKCQPWENFSQCEFAWTSFNRPAKLISMTSADKNKIHPTQKPIALYAYLIQTFAKSGDKILDTHLGSGSSRIAAYKMGFDFYGTEIDKEYFNAQEERFRRECLGEFKTAKGTIIQQSLFEL